MNVKDYDYYLPEELIAQNPLEKRDTSKLMVLKRDENLLKHETFYDIVKYFNEGDVLVVNNSKVLPARLHGKKVDTNAHIEVLLLKETNKDVWEILVKPQRRVKVGTTVSFNDKLTLEILELRGSGIATCKLIYDGILYEILEELGEMPLPPYIKKKLDNRDRYQTIYAKELGSAAAPTAGFHFTDEIIKKLLDKGVEILEVTLHVGLGTFRPVEVLKVEDHKMHSETYYIDKLTADKLNEAKKNGKKITAVGTTTVRTLESNFDNGFKPGIFETNIFIYPGYKFKVIDHLITNFHLPKSTLLMLVSAFYQKDKIIEAYQEAISKNYRFFSFGDAMLIY